MYKQYLEIVQVDSLLGVGHAEEGEDEEHGEDGPHEVPDRDDSGVPVNIIRSYMGKWHKFDFTFMSLKW